MPAAVKRMAARYRYAHSSGGALARPEAVPGNAGLNNPVYAGTSSGRPV